MGQVTNPRGQAAQERQRQEMLLRGKAMWRRMVWLAPVMLVFWIALALVALDPTNQWWWRVPFYAYFAALAITVLIDLLQQWLHRNKDLG